VANLGLLVVVGVVDVVGLLVALEAEASHR
jgi:hypothetical protein